MTNSTTLGQKTNRVNVKNSAAYILNLVGLIVGGAVMLTSLSSLSAPGFFAGLAGAMFCLDGVR